MVKKIAQIFICIFAGAIICCVLTSLVWYFILPLFPKGSSNSFPPISADEGYILITLLMGFLGLITGAIIGFLIAITDFQKFLGTIFGGIIGILIPALILSSMTANAHSRGSTENLLPMILIFLPQIPISGLSGFLVSLVSNFTRKSLGQ